MPAHEFVDKLFEFLVNPIIYFLGVVALFLFLWGLVKFIAPDKADVEGHQTGKRNMIWGLVGLFIIFTVSAIISFLQGLAYGIFST